MPPSRRSLVAFLVLMLWNAESSRAQDAGGWTLTLGVEGLRFGGSAEDTVGSPDAAVSLRPSGRVGVRMAAQRQVGRWAFGATVGWAQGDAEASNGAVAIRDRTADLSRYRLGVSLERAVATVGNGSLVLELGPTLDLWTVEGDTRTCAGVEAGLALRLPLGGLTVEQRLLVGVSASPLEAGDVGEGYAIRSLKTIGFGIGIRLPL